VTHPARLLTLLAVLAFAYLLVGSNPPPASAGAIVVETELDDFQANSLCTLRDAILSANLDTDANGDCEQGNAADTIMVPSGTYELDGLMIAGELVLTEDVQIIGAGAGTTLIDGLDEIRVLHVEDNVDATVSGVTLQGGRVGLSGGGIYNEGSLTLSGVIVDDNHATVDGGGIYNEVGATLTVLNTDITNNTALTGGAGIFNLGTLTVDGVDIGQNTADGGGGALRNEGTAALSDILVSGNTAGFGGGIYNGGTLTLSESAIDDNDAIISGGGGIRSDGTTTVDRTSITNNFGDASGGGYWSVNDDMTTITNSTLSGNSALVGDGMQAGGGGMASTVNLENVTISGNAGIGLAIVGGAEDTVNITHATFFANSGANLTTGAAVVNVANTIISNAGASNCSGALTSLGNNLEDREDCAFDDPEDIQNEDPLLGPLQDNGGPTFTHALLQGSPALGAADDALCTPTDQRGVSRPQGDGCDIGAFESGLTAATPTPTPAPTLAPTATPTPSPTLTPTPPPSPVPTPGPGLIWGDHDCSGFADPIDSLLTLRHDAGLGTDTGDCPDFGAAVPASGPALTWGDVDCNGTIDPIDALKLLRHDAGLSVQQEEGCPNIGDGVVVLTP
jgi:CSLREA domain-containing protein